MRPDLRTASVRLTPMGLLLSVEGGPPFQWDYAAIRREDNAQPNSFHREESGVRTGERLQIVDPAFVAALAARCPALGGGAAHRARIRNRVIAWSVACIAGLAALVAYGLPTLAGWMAPAVPWRTEAALGRAMEGEFLRSIGGGQPRLCEGSGNPAARRAFDAMVSRLTSIAKLPGQVEVRIVDAPTQNAFALPGGRIFLLRGLIEQAEHPDEVAGVLAHELGHVANRDAMRAIIHAGGVSVLIGLMIGDVTGAGALVVTTKYLLGTRYSRAKEAEADAFAIDLMNRAGGDSRRLGGFLGRVARQSGERQLELLSSHPVTEDRIAAINRGSSGTGQGILDDAEWRAFRAICR